jgi:superfamily II DNA or RNA helicase
MAYRIQENNVVIVPFSFRHPSLPPCPPPSRSQYAAVSAGGTAISPTISLRPYQQEIVEEVIDVLKCHGSALLALYTGSGKSLIASYLSSKIGLRTLIVTHGLVVMAQWKQNLNKYFPNLTVGVLSHKKVAKTDDECMIINAQNISKIDPAILSTFGTVIVDECFAGKESVLVRDLLQGEDFPMSFNELAKIPIHTLRTRYQVLSYNEVNHSFEFRHILHVWGQRVPASRLKDIHLSNGAVVSVTGEHRFLMSSGVFAAVNDIDLADKKDPFFSTFSLHDYPNVRTHVLNALKIMGRCCRVKNASHVRLEFPRSSTTICPSSILSYMVSLKTLKQRRVAASVAASHRFSSACLVDTVCMLRRRRRTSSSSSSSALIDVSTLIFPHEYPSADLNEGVFACWFLESTYTTYPLQQVYIDVITEAAKDASMWEGWAYPQVDDNYSYRYNDDDDDDDDSMMMMMIRRCHAHQHPGGEATTSIFLHSDVSDIGIELAHVVSYMRDVIGLRDIRIHKHSIELKYVSDVTTFLHWVRDFLPSNHFTRNSTIDPVDIRRRPESESDVMVYDMSVPGTHNYVIYTGGGGDGDGDTSSSSSSSSSWSHNHIVAHNCHLIMAKTLMTNLLQVSPRFLMGLSATPYRPDGLHTLFEYFFGPESRYISRELYREHRLYVIPTAFKPSPKQRMDGTRDWNHVLQEQAADTDRNNLIISIVHRLIAEQRQSILILVKRVNHGNVLYDELTGTAAGLVVSRVYDKFTEIHPSEQVVVATISKAGVGFDRPRLDTLIVGADVEEYFIQYLGRVFRTPEVVPHVYDFKDKDPTLRRHLQTRIDTCTKCGAILA